MQQAQLLRRRMAVMNTRNMAPSVPNVTGANVTNLHNSSNSGNGSGSGSSSGNGGGNGNGNGEISPTSAVTPSSSGMNSMNTPHQSGIGMKPGTQKPPANVLQVVKQVIH